MQMAAALPFAVLAFSCALLVASVSSLPPAVFKVGDERGWKVPANGTETYNHWAKRNVIQVGDVLSFKYANDSVLLVTHDDYKQCHTATPLSRFASGDSKIKLDHYGPIYFVSGTAGHCEAGQRMIVRVRAPASLNGAPAAAPGIGMPPTVSGGRAGAPSPRAGAPSPRAGTPSPRAGAPSSPISSPTAVPPIGRSGAGSAASTAPTPSPTPSPLPQASGASSRRVHGVMSSVTVGLVVLVAITLSVVVV